MKKYLILLIAILLGAPSLLYGQSDLVEVMTPNAMIIFDSSASMNSQADGTTANAGWKQVDKDGNTFPIGTAPWNWVYFEGSGNHPDSKLYQAKLALKKVITDLVDINLGFSTYAQFKTDARVGRYKRDRSDCTGGSPAQGATNTTCTWKKLYWRWNTYTDFRSSTSSLPQGNFTDVWGQVQTGMSVGSKLYKKNHTFIVKTAPPHPPNTYLADLEYTITNITLNAEMNYYKYDYSATYDTYETWNFTKTKDTTAAVCNSMAFYGYDCDSEFPPTQPGVPNVWQTYDSTLTNYPEDSSAIVPANKWTCICTGCIAGHGPIAAVPCTFGPEYPDYLWRWFAGTICPLTDLSAPAQNLGKVPGLGHYWTALNYFDNCYDSSSYTYPSTGSTDYPHTWSYFRIQGGKWPIDNVNKLDVQPKPFYPSSDGTNPNDNPGTFDNHYFFINIPKVDDSTTGYPIKNAILALLDLTPVQNPQTTYWWTKLPLKPNSLTANTSGTPQNQTPIADSLFMAKRYFEDYIKQDPPSTAKCRGNYIILLTDGLESGRFLDPPTNLMPDFDLGATASQELYNIGVNTFVIGFGKAAGTNLNALNKIARAGSNNIYDAFFTDTLAGLTNAIQTIFQIIQGSYSRSNPVVTRNRNRLYRGYFNLPGYEGHLAAYDLNTDGTIKTPETWDAGKIMSSAAKRGTVYTWVVGNFGLDRFQFKDNEVNHKDKDNKTLGDFLNPSGEDIDSDGKTDKKDSETIINFALEPNYDDCTYLPPLKCHGPGNYKGVRSGKWILGDVYHSTPLVVGPPVFNFPDIPGFAQKYADFKTTWASRETLIYVGANDGMLHAIKDSDGTEKFAVVPQNLHGKLKNLRTNSHQFFVDSSPRAYDVFFGGQWRTIIINGERGGGNYYFAVDVTDPADPQMLWEKTDPGMGNTWSRPEIGWVRISGVEKFVAFVGGGYSDPLDAMFDNIGNTFYAIDIEDGTILRKFVVGNAKNKIPAGGTAFDSDLDGRVNGVYFGDNNGVLWKIKIDGEEDVSKWQLITLNTPSTNNSPVFYPPAVTKNNQAKILVYYGQGNELNLFEQVSSNSFFEIWDKGDSGQKNWEEALGAGEKVLAAPALANNIVYFTTWKYTGDITDCGAGKGRLYGLTTTSLGTTGGIGALLLDPLTGKEIVGGPKKYFEITDYFPASRGIPSGPVVTNGMIYVSTSLNAGQVITIPIPGWGTGRLKYWREVF
jgi:hypothetical protein